MNKLIGLALAAAAFAGCVTPQAAAPRILGHRGTRGEYQENCPESIQLVLDRGVVGFETDIRMTKDGHLVIMHDANVARVSDGKGAIEELTLAELKEFSLNNSSDRIPTLEEMLTPLKGRSDVFIELEMKSSAITKAGRLDEYLNKSYETAKRVLQPGTYAFTSFDVDYLKRMRELHADAVIGLIASKPMSEELIARAVSLGCSRVAPLLKGTTKELVDKAHAEGLLVTLWMVQNKADYDLASSLGADATTSDYPILLKRAVDGRRKKVVAMDLDATLCQHRSPVPWKNLKALEALQAAGYTCVMSGAGNAPRIYGQMGEFPVSIVGNYGMQEAEVRDGQLVIVRAVTNKVDEAFFREKTDYLRKKYGYTEYEGKPLEFHASGMVTFGLLGTAPSAEHKVAFDPDRRKRRAMYPEVCEIFKDYSVYIGGSTSFDFAGKENNKYDATLDWARRHGFELDDIVFIGDDFADGGGDSHVRIKGMDHIVINNYRNFADAVSVLLK